jgi:hypothetical protein
MKYATGPRQLDERREWSRGRRRLIQPGPVRQCRGPATGLPQKKATLAASILLDGEDEDEDIGDAEASDDCAR